MIAEGTHPLRSTADAHGQGPGASPPPLATALRACAALRPTAAVSPR